MQSAWTKGLKGPEKAERIKEVLSFRTAFEELAQVIRGNLKKKEAVRDYKDGWVERQIATNEYNAAIDDLLRLISLNHKED